ncbi:hypothetical protein EV121DRAFT_298246 [Schizophyllum commune]
MQVVCEATQNQSVPVQVGAFECLVRIMSLYYEKMSLYMEQALGLTVVGMKHLHPDSRVAVELWCEVVVAVIAYRRVVFSAHPSFAGPPAHGLPVKGPQDLPLQRNSPLQHTSPLRRACAQHNPLRRGSVTSSSSMTPPSSDKTTASTSDDEREGEPALAPEDRYANRVPQPATPWWSSP